MGHAPGRRRARARRVLGYRRAAVELPSSCRRARAVELPSSAAVELHSLEGSLNWLLLHLPESRVPADLGRAPKREKRDTGRYSDV